MTKELLNYNDIKLIYLCNEYISIAEFRDMNQEKRTRLINEIKDNLNKIKSKDYFKPYIKNINDRIKVLSNLNDQIKLSHSEVL